MNVSEAIRRTHPLHALRKLRLFQSLSRRFDPMILWRLSIFPRPIYLRALSHGSMLLGASGQESSIYETFAAIVRAMPNEASGAFWDVGANIGFFSWMCATVRPDFEIVSFEPDPKNVACLSRTSQRWHLSRHTIVPRAVAEKSGRADFLVDYLSGATGSLETSQNFNALHYGSAPAKIEVETVSLDDFHATDVAPPQIIKIDIEGAELRALKGAAELLAQYQPVLFFETYEHRDKIAELLQGQGYFLFDSDRRSKINDETINFIAVVIERWPRVVDSLTNLGYPAAALRPT